jgi:hypothetical protein
MKEHWVCWIMAYSSVLTAAMVMLGQAPSDPITHQSAAPVQQEPETRIRARVSLVSTPVTVVNSEGELVSNLDEKDLNLI